MSEKLAFTIALIIILFVALASKGLINPMVLPFLLIGIALLIAAAYNVYQAVRAGVFSWTRVIMIIFLLLLALYLWG